MNFLGKDNRALIIAMDHARTHGIRQNPDDPNTFLRGLEDPGNVIDAAIEGGADGLMTTFGVVKRFRDRLIGHIPTILRLDGGPSFYREEWLHYTEWSLLHTVEEALLLGVDGVVVNLFLGGEMELRTYEIIAEVAGQALNANVPLFVEAMPCPSERIPDTKAGEAIASASRLAFEHGADYIKNYYTGSIDSYRQVVEWCPVPVLIAGGAKMDTEEQALQMTYDALQAGAAGVFFGRNVWQNQNVVGMIRALRHVIHDNGSVQEALDWLK